MIKFEEIFDICGNKKRTLFNKGLTELDIVHMLSDGMAGLEEMALYISDKQANSTFSKIDKIKTSVTIRGQHQLDRLMTENFRYINMNDGEEKSIVRIELDSTDRKMVKVIFADEKGYSKMSAFTLFEKFHNNEFLVITQRNNVLISKGKFKNLKTL